MTKIAINGFGRIGRLTFRRILKEHPDLEVAAVNDLASPEVVAHLLRYDSVYGIYDKRVKFTKGTLLIDGTADGKQVRLFAESDPANLPWQELGIDIVLECTGVFRDFESANKHILAGAKKVIISAPSKDPDKIPSFVLGVNEEDFEAQKHQILDMSSCTTNCLAPVVKVLDDNFKLVKGLMTTVHSYTNDQRILDLAHKDLRRARAAAFNIIPTTTGASKAIGKLIAGWQGKLDGLSLRVPVPIVSVLDLVSLVQKSATAEEVNYVFKKASDSERLKGILGIEDAPLVSSDYIGNSFSAIVDAGLTMVEGNLIKIVAWYDNEYAYACRLAEFAEYVGRKLRE